MPPEAKENPSPLKSPKKRLQQATQITETEEPSFPRKRTKLDTRFSISLEERIAQRLLEESKDKELKIEEAAKAARAPPVKPYIPDVDSDLQEDKPIEGSQLLVAPRSPHVSDDEELAQDSLPSPFLQPTDTDYQPKIEEQQKSQIQPPSPTMEPLDNEIMPSA